MSGRRPGLLAAYWTLAGDVYPGAPLEVSPFPLEDRAAAAATAGYVGLGLVHEDIQATVARIGYPGIRRILGDHGLEHVELEFLNDWYARCGGSGPPGVRPGADGAARGRRGARRAQREVSPHLFDEGPPDVPLIRDEFARLCDQARDAGTNIVMEMMPFTNVDTIERALAIIAGADQPNGGILLDIWHVARPGIDYADVATIPARVPPRSRARRRRRGGCRHPFEDTRLRRRLPGRGRLRRARVPVGGRSGRVRGAVLRRRDHLGAYRRQPLEVMARTSFEATMVQVELARPTVAAEAE